MTSDPTPLDQAHAAMEAAPDDTQARLAWFDRLAATEMFLLLEDEAGADSVKPKVFAVDGADLVLAFDREERLSAFAGDVAPFVALSGRALAGMLTEAGLGMAVNLGTSAETVLEVEAVAWLAGTLSHRPETVEDRPDEILAPNGLPDTLLTTLDARLAAAEGRARLAYLVATKTDAGRRGHLLAFVDHLPGAEGGLAQLVGEALSFSGLEAASLDVGFFKSADPICARLAKVGLRFDLPELVAPPERSAPGSDPDRPPRLR
ncbi:SseB family protein [Hasllibacter sp. MH4015]|uniref:SseB family protein n=1 Tax=Hasllibacter sp. MH4015 TaxID=2854029 RepID=UPI001CD2A4D5|nr:SseB family protein [Hasllibacter sp. MH4015]